MNKKKIIWAVVVLILIILFGWLLFKEPSKQQVSNLDSIDTVTNFYGQWLQAVKEPATADPNLATLAKSPILSKALRTQLKKAPKQSDTTPDPVLCQTVIPEEISIRSVYEQENKAQILVTSKDTKVTNQATVTLIGSNNSWYIDSIECSLGEFGVEREFSFEKGGFILKSSIPSPFNPKDWHLIFEENGELGHVVPLFYDSESQCTSLDGSKSVCTPDKFTEATKVFVRGQMTERGLSVKQQEFVK